MKKQFRFLYLVLALALVLTLTSASLTVTADGIKIDTGLTVENDVVTEEAVEAEALFQLDEFTKLAEYSGVELYMLDKTNEWVCFAMRDTKTDKVWYSIPQYLDRMTVALKKREARSTGIITYQNEDKNNATLYTSDAIKDGDYKIENITDGVRITYEYPLKKTESGKKLFGFTIPMTFRLTKDGGFEAGVEFSSIKTHKDTEYNIISIGVLPYFGSAEYQSEGYMLIPDGSGALIANDYMPLDGVTKRLTLNVYGKDSALNHTYSLGNIEKTVLPVFGTKSNDQGYVAVINNGDAVASIASVPGRTNVPYTSVYADFTYYYQDTFDTTNNWFNKAYNQVAYKSTDIDLCSVVYYPLSGEDSDYIGMAERYRKYLVDIVGVEGNVSPNVSFNLDTIGAITKSVSKFGFVVDAVQDVTTYEEAGKMISEFSKCGIDNIDFRMTGWMDGGMETRVVTNAKTESLLGGKKGLNSLISTAKKSNTDLFFDVDLVNVYKSKFNWSIRKVAVRNILNEYAEQYFFKLDSGIKNEGRGTHYLIDPSFYKTQLEKFNKDFDSYKQKNISLGSLGNTLYSNFSNGDKFKNRQQTEQYAQKALELADSKYENVAVDTGNAYTYKYADKIIALPMYASGYEVTSTDVPFAQIALHGLIEYTETAHNLADDPTVQFLRMLETGSMPYYLLTWSESTVFLDTDFNYIYSSNFYTWNQTAVRDYKTLASVLNGYCDKPITDHQIINDNVRATTYGDELTVVVNYGEDNYDYQGATVLAGGFIVVKEGV